MGIDCNLFCLPPSGYPEMLFLDRLYIFEPDIVPSVSFQKPAFVPAKELLAKIETAGFSDGDELHPFARYRRRQAAEKLREWITQFGDDLMAGIAEEQDSAGDILRYARRAKF